MQYYHDDTASALTDAFFDLSRKAGPKAPRGALLVVTFATLRQYLFVTMTLQNGGGGGSIFCWSPLLPSDVDRLKKWARGTDLVRVVNLNRSEVGNLVACLRDSLPVLSSVLRTNPVLDGRPLAATQEIFLKLEREALHRN